MKYQIIEETEVYSGYINVIQAEIKHDVMNQNEQIKITREAAHVGNSCAILLLEKETNRFIFTNQFRYATTKSGLGWITEIVAGNIDDGETAEKSIIREVDEEVGYEINQIEEYGTYFLSPGRSTEKQFLFFAEVSKDDKKNEGGGGLSSEDEYINVEYIDVAEAKKMLFANQFEDAKTIIALQHYFLKNS